MGPQFLGLRADRAPHRHRVGPAQLGDAHPDGRLAQGAADAPPVLEPVLHHRHVPQANGRAFLVGDDELREGLDVDGLALGAHVHLALGRLDAAGRHLEVLAGDGAVDVVHGQALRLHAHRVVPDPHRPVAVARELHVAHALDGLELGLDHVPNVVGDESGRTAAREGQADDRLVFGIGLRDHRRVDAPGQTGRGLGDLRLHILESGVDVAVEVELDVDAGRALPGGGRDLLHSFDRGDDVLDGVDHVRLQDLGGRAFVGHRDVDEGEIDVGILADAEALEDASRAREAEGAEADEREHQHPGEDVVADRDVGQGHARGDLLDVFLLFLLWLHRVASGEGEGDALAIAPVTA